ncbi:MAG TPA: DNA-formamidopyrimidine glycosylase [Thermomicrobiales bacterium]
MPELPEVETVRTTLEPAVRGRTIQGLRVGAFEGVLDGERVEDVARRVIGRRIVQLRRRGKYLILVLDDDSALVVHLRMTGRLVRRDRSAPPERFEHMAIELDDGTDLRFADQRKFGRVKHVGPDELRQLDASLGVEPLDPSFTTDTLAALLQRRTGRLKSVLLDQALMAGLGNIYADEALFRARLHPLRTANRLTADEVSRLHAAIQDVLREGLVNRGTTFSSYRDGRGEPGENQRNLRVYGKGGTGEPCPTCSTPLVRIVVGGRGSHICPTCQPLESLDTQR